MIMWHIFMMSKPCERTEKNYSYITGLVIQALRALGREHVDETVIRSLRESLPVEEKSILLKEAQGTTAWIFDFIKEICRRN